MKYLLGFVSCLRKGFLKAFGIGKITKYELNVVSKIMQILLDCKALLSFTHAYYYLPHL